jgi:hypothetical protein
MMDRQTGLGPEPIDRLPRVIVRAVVGDDQLEIAMALRSKPPNHFFQPGRLVIRGHDDRHVHGELSKVNFGALTTRPLIMKLPAALKPLNRNEKSKRKPQRYGALLWRNGAGWRLNSPCCWQ